MPRAKGRRGDAQLIAALTAGATIKAAAGMAGVSEATVYSRLQKSEFRRQIAEAKASVIAEVVARLGLLAKKALNRLDRMLDDPKAPAPAVVSAIRCSIEFLYRGAAAVNVEERLAELEAKLRKNHANATTASQRFGIPHRSNGAARGLGNSGEAPGGLGGDNGNGGDGRGPVAEYDPPRFPG
jgi:hypothetical protein